MSTNVSSHTHKTKTHDIRQREKNSAAVLPPSVCDLAPPGRGGGVNPLGGFVVQTESVSQYLKATGENYRGVTRDLVCK